MPRPRKYPIHEIQVGETSWIKFPVDPKTNQVVEPRRRWALRMAVIQEEKRYGKKFNCQGSGEGLLITRVK